MRENDVIRYNTLYIFELMSFLLQKPRNTNIMEIIENTQYHTSLHNQMMQAIKIKLLLLIFPW